MKKYVKKPVPKDSRYVITDPSTCPECGRPLWRCILFSYKQPEWRR